MDLASDPSLTPSSVAAIVDSAIISTARARDVTRGSGKFQPSSSDPEFVDCHESWDAFGRGPAASFA